MTRILTIPRPGSLKISMSDALRADIVKWVSSATFITLLFLAIAILVGQSKDNNTPLLMSTAYMAQRPEIQYGLAILACILARTSVDGWTWILAIVTIMLSSQPTNSTLATTLFPNSILSMMITMVGLLCVARLFEYWHMRHIIGLTNPTMTVGAILLYTFTALLCVVLNSPYIFS